jgi:hypothetical protein
MATVQHATSSMSGLPINLSEFANIAKPADAALMHHNTYIAHPLWEQHHLPHQIILSGDCKPGSIVHRLRISCGAKPSTPFSMVA